MSRRSADWNKGLAQDLRRPEFAQLFIQNALEEGLSIQVVLGAVIRAYGVKEFSVKVGLPSSNILRVLRPKHNPTLESINRLVKPFGLELSMAPIARRRAA